MQKGGKYASSKLLNLSSGKNNSQTKSKDKSPNPLHKGGVMLPLCEGGWGDFKVLIFRDFLLGAYRLI